MSSYIKMQPQTARPNDIWNKIILKSTSVVIQLKEKSLSIEAEVHRTEGRELGKEGETHHLSSNSTNVITICCGHNCDIWRLKLHLPPSTSRAHTSHDSVMIALNVKNTPHL